MVSKVFVDSDIVIDLFTNRMPFANAASELFELNEQKKIKIYLSTASINGTTGKSVGTESFDFKK